MSHAVITDSSSAENIATNNYFEYGIGIIKMTIVFIYNSDLIKIT